MDTLLLHTLFESCKRFYKMLYNRTTLIWHPWNCTGVRLKYSRLSAISYIDLSSNR